MKLFCFVLNFAVDQNSSAVHLHKAARLSLAVRSEASPSVIQQQGFMRASSPISPPIVETAVDREPWSAGLTRITWIPAWSLGGHQAAGNRKAASLLSLFVFRKLSLFNGIVS